MITSQRKVEKKNNKLVI